MTDVDDTGTSARPRQRMATAALILMLGNVLSRLLGLVREQLAAGLFGTGNEIAAFTIADNVQTLLFDLVASGAMQAALIPIMAQYAAPHLATRRQLRSIGGTLIVLTIVGVGAAVLIGELFAGSVVDTLIWISGDQQARGPETVALTIRLVRIVLPTALFLTVGTVLQAMLYAVEQVTAPALSTAVRNMLIVTMTALFGAAWGVEAMAWGTLAGAIGIVLLMLVALIRHRLLPTLGWGIHHPAFRKMWALYLPVFLGFLFNSIAIVVDRGLAWGAGENAVGAMRYATTLVQLTLGIVAAAIALASLPTLSRLFQAADELAFRQTLGRALAMVTLLIFPATFALAALSTPIASLLFGFGATNADGTRQITLALLGYLPGTLAAAYDQVFIFSFYARHNTRLPVIIGVIAIGVYFAFAFTLVHRLEMMGLVLANSAQFIAHTLIIAWFGRRRFGWDPSPPLRRLVPITAGAAGLAAAGALATWSLMIRIPAVQSSADSVAFKGALVVVPAAVFVAGYGSVLLLLLPDLLNQLISLLRARLPGSHHEALNVL